MNEKVNETIIRILNNLCLESREAIKWYTVRSTIIKIYIRMCEEKEYSKQEIHEIFSDMIFKIDKILTEKGIEVI
jgi:hypothetical protein